MSTPSTSQVLDNYTLSQLDKIYSGHVNLKRRVINELKEFANYSAYIHVEYQECVINYRKSSIFITIVPNNEDNLYQFSIQLDYPFKPPNKFLINYKDYKQILKIESPKTLSELKLYTKYKCLCCDTLFCSDKWSPLLQLQNYIDEFNYIKKCRRYIINRLLSEKIVNKYLISDINLNEWLF